MGAPGDQQLRERSRGGTGCTRLRPFLSSRSRPRLPGPRLGTQHLARDRPRPWRRALAGEPSAGPDHLRREAAVLRGGVARFLVTTSITIQAPGMSNLRLIAYLL